MPSESSIPTTWPAATLESLAEAGSVTYGVVQPGLAVTEGVPLVRVNNFRGSCLDTSEILRIAPEVEAKYSRTRLRKDDVLITVVGTIGQVAVVPSSMAGWNVARAVAVIRPKDVQLARWIALALRTPNARDSLGMTANTTVQTTINLKDLRKLLIPLPPERFRKPMEKLLCSLDDRIDVLRQSSATVESITQAIFKSWFVDFDPVRAKADGREPEGMDAATAMLFPTEFESSALGSIPRGWSVRQFGDFAALAKGSVNPLAWPSSVFEHYSLPAFDVDQLPVFEAGEEIKSNKTRVPRNAVLQSKLNPHIPRVWFTSDSGDQAVCSTEFLPWVARESSSPEFVYCVLCSAAFGVLVRTLVTGTSNSHQRVRADQVSALGIVGSTPSVLDAFTNLVRPMLRKAAANRLQARALEQMRDALLPRLLSGRIRLPECQEYLAEAVA